MFYLARYIWRTKFNLMGGQCCDTECLICDGVRQRAALAYKGKLLP
jgi:hypothetical protein